MPRDMMKDIIRKKSPPYTLDIHYMAFHIT